MGVCPPPGCIWTSGPGSAVLCMPVTPFYMLRVLLRRRLFGVC